MFHFSVFQLSCVQCQQKVIIFITGEREYTCLLPRPHEEQLHYMTPANCFCAFINDVKNMRIFNRFALYNFFHRS